MLKRLSLLSGLQKYHILLALPEAEWLPVGWSVKSHSSLSDECSQLDSPIFGKISLQLPLVAYFQASIHTVVAKSLDEIHVIHEYPDVFPDDLSGMPPDRAIEFKIELQPGTTPVYKRPYPMVLNELAKMKTQLQELLDKGYIRPISSPWGCPALFVKKDKTLHMCQLPTAQRSDHEEQVSVAPH
jgi:hypothetical protein